MGLLDFMKEHGVWIATILAAIIAGILGLIKKPSKINSQKVKNIKDSTIYQANDSITINCKDKME